MKIATVVGARPQFIKAAAVSRAIVAHNQKIIRLQINSGAVGDLPEAVLPRPGEAPQPISSPPSSADPQFIEEVLIHTGQHYDDGMSAVFFRELEIPEPQYNLGVGSGTHGRQTGEMLAAIERVLMVEKPAWVLIYGDTNSTLAGALAAAKLHIPIAHVEAGLRSFNRRMPEEINRVVADRLSTLLLCPSQVAADNLAAEGIPPGANAKFQDLTPKVVVMGDVMADALQFAATKAAARSDILERLGLQPHGYLLATIHRAENTDDPRRLSNIMAALTELAAAEPVIVPLHPRTKKILAGSFPSLLHRERPARAGRSAPPATGLEIIDPVGYFDIIALEKSARLLLTDSGGMQKEAYWLRVPCLTLRDETEWVETVAAGWNVLTGADRERIIRAARTFTPPAAHPPLYGDGQAAEKILLAICQG